MTDKEYEEYLNGDPTIIGIVTEMKSWWSDDECDKVVQNSLDKILELLDKQYKKITRTNSDVNQRNVCRTTMGMVHELGKDDPNISELNNLPLVVGYLLDCPKCGTTFVYHSDLKEVCPMCGEQILQQYLE